MRYNLLQEIKNICSEIEPLKPFHSKVFLYVNPYWTLKVHNLPHLKALKYQGWTPSSQDRRWITSINWCHVPGPELHWQTCNRHVVGLFWNLGTYLITAELSVAGCLADLMVLITHNFLLCQCLKLWELESMWTLITQIFPRAKVEKHFPMAFLGFILKRYFDVKKETGGLHSPYFQYHHYFPEYVRVPNVLRT